MFKKILSSSLTVGTATVLQFLTLFSVQVVLARILEPKEFGTFAIISTIVMFANSFANLQGDKYLIKEGTNSKRILNTIFTAEIIWSLILITLSFYLLPLILKPLNKEAFSTQAQALTLVFFLNPFTKTKAILEKDLSFIKATIPGIISNVIGGLVAIYFAHNGFGIWSLIFWRISTAIIDIIITWQLIPFKPKLEFDKDIFKASMSFGTPLIGGAIIAFAYGNIDYYLIDYLLKEEVLGYYWMAYQISHYLLSVRASINKVIFPALSLTKNATDSIKLFNLTTTFTSIFYLSLSFFTLLFAEEIILIVYGDKWLPTAILLKIFVCVISTKAIASNVAPLLHARGISAADLEVSLFNLIFLPPLIFLFTKLFGATGSALAILIVTNAAIIYIHQKFVKEIIQQNYFQYFSKVIFLFLFFLLITLLFHYSQEVNIITKLLTFSFSIAMIMYLYKTDVIFIFKKIDKNGKLLRRKDKDQIKDY